MIVNRAHIQLLLVLLSSQAGANTLVDDATGLILDPLGLAESSENILETAEIISNALDRTLLQLKELQSKTDLDIRDYLGQIDRMVSSVNSTLDQNVDQIDVLLMTLARKASELEKKVHSDALNLIWRAQCAAEVTATDTLQRALAQAINSIRASNPKFRIFGIPTGTVDLQPIDIKDPDIAYRAVKKQRLKLLHDQLEEYDDAYIIRSTYINLARLAKLTQCHYIDQDSEIIFVRDYYEFERLTIPWNRVVHIEG